MLHLLNYLTIGNVKCDLLTLLMLNIHNTNAVNPKAFINIDIVFKALQMLNININLEISEFSNVLYIEGLLFSTPYIL